MEKKGMEDCLGLSLGFKCYGSASSSPFVPNFDPKLYQSNQVTKVPESIAKHNSLGIQPANYIAVNLPRIDVNQTPPPVIDLEEEVKATSPNSSLSSVKGDKDVIDEEENGGSKHGVGVGGGGGGGVAAGYSGGGGIGSDKVERKKLRLSKEQTTLLERTFENHATLNTKQKVTLAKQLNLRPRQVEVWFQNRRARTKLKQTEVNCVYLRKSCAMLREENRRLLQELHALKAHNQQLAAMVPTTVCSSCKHTPTITAAPPPTNAHH